MFLLLFILNMMPMHSECQEKCREACDEIYKQCLADCGPDEKARQCRDDCYGGEARECFAHCEEGHHDPSC